MSSDARCEPLRQRSTGLRGVLMSLLAGAALASAGCAERTVPPAAAERQRLEMPGSVEAGQPLRCAAGQLCERSEPLLGLRLPAACAVRVQRPQLFVCSLRQVKLAEVELFYRTRGSAIVSVRGGLTIRPRQLVPGEPAEVLPLLVVQQMREDLLLTGTAAARPPVDSAAR